MEKLRLLLIQRKHEQFLKEFPINHDFILNDFVNLRKYTNDDNMVEVINEFIRKRFKMEDR